MYNSQKDALILSTQEVPKNQEERRLHSMWRSVITQALIDAASNSKKKQVKSIKKAAIEWLQGNSQDFMEVCALADMNPDYVKKQSQAAMQRGCKWRNDLRIMQPIVIA